MTDISAAFWNLQNLFDVTASEIAADLEFTPEEGWTEAALDAKIEALLDVAETLCDGRGPDLLGICEVENDALVRRLVDGLKTRLGREDYTFAHDEAPDIRGIDCALIYSDRVFELAGEPVGHLVHLRFPTRDIFEVPLRVKATGAELLVYVTHWPSRRSGAKASEPYRITLASHLGRLIDRRLKLPRQHVVAAPKLGDLLDEMRAAWDRNVMVMGDLNDDPFNTSVLEALRATNSLDRLEEELALPRDDRDLPPDQKRRKSDTARYLGQQADLYNLSWGPVGRSGEGTIFYSSKEHGRSKQVFDQIIVSRGLLFGRRGLRAAEADFAIHAPKLMWSNGRLAEDAERHLVRPKPFDRKKLTG